MLKKILIAVGCLCLVGCSVQKKRFESTDFLKTEAKKTKTAVLLPLSGDSVSLGDAFRNAILMAQLERSTDEATEVFFYDTKGTPDGAVESYQQAKNEDADIVLGPIFSAEVAKISALNPSMPVISFTSDTSALDNDVYTMALLINQQVHRIVDFACQKGQQRFALLGPKDKTGEIVLNAFHKAIESCPTMQLSHVSMYDTKNPDLTNAVAKIAPPLIDLKKDDLTEEEKELATNPTAERIEFDALFVFEQGVRLQQLVSLLGYYDVTPNLVSFYGLATLRAQHNRDLVGTYFADLPQEKLRLFQKNYKEAFGSKPIMVSALGYDAISLVSYLSKKGILDKSSLEVPEGYFGINGRFRFNETGSNDRLLEMFQIRGKNYIIKVDSAKPQFD
ncbi:MAG: penicillin-binding protein activator [Alphaproteobacteria bacterium]|nr:penicillin-binding protein activator [Alphaproteobacteria bacterium]